MSKRKKTTTSKNTQPKLTKVQLTKKIKAIDSIEIAKLAGQTGVIGAAFRINYHQVAGTLNRKESMCSKCIQPIEKVLNTTAHYGIETEEDREDLGNAIAATVSQLYNNDLPKSMADLDLATQVSTLFTMLMAYVFVTDEMKNYCADKKESRVGILVTYNVRYDVETDEFQTNLRINSRDNFETWIIDGTELISDDNATVIKGY
jgi:hypothetical protein